MEHFAKLSCSLAAILFATNVVAEGEVPFSFAYGLMNREAGGSMVIVRPNQRVFNKEEVCCDSPNVFGYVLTKQDGSLFTQYVKFVLPKKDGGCEVVLSNESEWEGRSFGFLHLDPDDPAGVYAIYVYANGTLVGQVEFEVK